MQQSQNLQNIVMNYFQIICKAIACCTLAVMWYLESLDDSNPDRDQMKAVKKRLNYLMRICYALLFHQQDKVRVLALCGQSLF